MAGEWVKRKIGSLGRVVTGKTPTTADSSNFGGPYPFITIPDLDGRVLIDRTERTLSERGAEILRSCLLPPGAVMMSCIATVGKCGITTQPSFTNQQINSVIPNDDVDSRFLYYVFTQLGHELESSGSGGSVYTNVSKSRFSNIEVLIPVDLGEQRAIAHILGTLDDKIELNRRLSETLEQMARALFKAWFVDFEPVRAKMEGRWQRGQSLPGLPAHLYDLFPDRLVESELGEIPEGWEVKAIGEMAEVVGGSTPKTNRAEFWEGGTYHWVTPKDLSHLSLPVLLDTERKITDAGLAQISSGLLPQGTVLLSSRAPIGYLAIAEVPVAVNQGFIAMRPRQGVSNLFLLHWARAAHDEIISHANGSTFLEISKASFRPIRLVAPPPAVMLAYDRLSRPLYRRVVENERESHTLAALRDALLPKLIRGEIRVKDAERFLKERGLC
ncbi:MAG: restriction endonuclease subunit S [Acidobacteria bacterium]|nr:MAG: restriction endonuclease subunit S [Acidobacteriota bacterium]GIU83153.1 MAG: hypothetical protein KatS3mg006_2217 [Pyrinomonadaceae bacterium]